VIIRSTHTSSTGSSLSDMIEHRTRQRAPSRHSTCARLVLGASAVTIQTAATRPAGTQSARGTFANKRKVMFPGFDGVVVVDFMPRTGSVGAFHTRRG
jgi:hypothetical protein